MRSLWRACSLYGDKDLKGVVAAYDGIVLDTIQRSALTLSHAKASKGCDRQVSNGGS